MIRLALAVIVACLIGGCVSPPKAYLPVDSQLKPWEAPESEDPEAAVEAPEAPEKK
jgi:hypothetical protein